MDDKGKDALSERTRRDAERAAGGGRDRGSDKGAARGGKGGGKGGKTKKAAELLALKLTGAKSATVIPTLEVVAPSGPALCVGPLNEPLDIIVCNKSVVLLRALEAAGAAPGSVLMLDTQPPEEAGLLYYQGAAQDVLYTRRWRRVYVAAPCTHTANSGASSRAAKMLIGLVLAAIAFAVWCYCAPADAVFFEHSRSCLGTYWLPPDQVVSPVRTSPCEPNPSRGSCRPPNPLGRVSITATIYLEGVTN